MGDVDGDGDISMEEVKIIMEDHALSAYLRVLGFEVLDAERLFSLLDDDNSGKVCLTEFLEGCMRLKGGARSIDIHALMVECRRLTHKVDDFMGEFIAAHSHESLNLRW